MQYRINPEIVDTFEIESATVLGDDHMRSIVTYVLSALYIICVILGGCLAYKVGDVNLYTIVLSAVSNPFSIAIGYYFGKSGSG